ncbi:MAG: hypothetical protein ACKOD2_07665, partial [Ilumatobacteraceae bacterium]
AVLSAAHMLEFLGEKAAATVVRAACVEPTSGSTSQIGDELARRVGAAVKAAAGKPGSGKNGSGKKSK